MKNETFESFINRMRSRYGQSRMDNHTAAMWYDKLKHLDDSEFEAVTMELIGSREHVFGWKAVIEKHDIMYPQVSEQLEKGEGQQTKFNEYITNTLSAIKSRRISQEEWVDKASDLFIESYGRTEAKRMVRVYDEGIFLEFRRVVMEKINNGKGHKQTA